MATLLQELRNLLTALKSLAGGGICFPNVPGHGKADGTHVTTALQRCWAAPEMSDSLCNIQQELLGNVAFQAEAK